MPDPCTQPSPQRGEGSGVWRSFEEVFDLALDGESILAATDGGLLKLRGRVWTAETGASGIRSIDQVEPLTLSLATGIQLLSEPRFEAQPIPKRQRTLWTGVLVEPSERWLGNDPVLRARFQQPPPAHVYTLLARGSNLYAGTSSGLYRAGPDGVWTREALPTSLPVSRPNGIAQVGTQYVIGGLGGLYLGSPGHWRQVVGDAIRQIVRSGNDVWVVHGNGALDRMEILTGRIFPDLLTGSAKRPWTSCVGFSGSSVLLGGFGGWTERRSGLASDFLDGGISDVVTAIAGRLTTRWFGTQTAGLTRVGPLGRHVWNPGNGLGDTWVTCLRLAKDGLFVGTAHSGLYRVIGDRIEPVGCPTKRVTALGLWKSQLVLGGMDGAWIRKRSHWRALSTGGEETTSIAVVGDRLAVTTASGAFFFR